MSKTKVEYVAAFLKPDQQGKLMERFPPKFDNTFYHHVTIIHMSEAGGNLRVPENAGDEIELEVIGYAEDEKGQAVVVRGIESSKAVPHITLSCAPGVRPFYSNTLLSKGYRELENPFYLTAVVGAKELNSDTTLFMPIPEQYR
jgi:hypothetical protein